MRITFVAPFVNLTGGIRLLLDYANWLHGRGHVVTVVYPLWPYRFHFGWRARLEEFRRQMRTAPRVEWLDLRCDLRRVPFIANRWLPRADLVVATSWPTAHDVARLDASRGTKVQIVFHHESGTGPERRIRDTYTLPFHRITFSRFVHDTIAQQFGCAIDAVVPAGVDTAVFFPDGEPRADTVLMLHHNDPRKGAVDGIQALARLREHRPDVRVRMCGTVWPAHLPQWIAFDFHPHDADLRRLYSTSTVFLYPSRYEGFGLPPLEAMACACAVVTTEVGAVPEFAVDGHNALVVAPGDITGMAGRLHDVLAGPPLRAQLSAHGRETAGRYAIARVAPQFEEALLHALDARDRRHSMTARC